MVGFEIHVSQGTSFTGSWLFWRQTVVATRGCEDRPVLKDSKNWKFLCKILF